MKKHLLSFIACLGLISFAHAPAHAAAITGEAAPAFSALDTHANPITLDGLKGKIVVLEWTNDGCPFVRKHYDGGNMQKTQAAVAGDDVVWISVISSAEGKQGYVDAEGANKIVADNKAQPSHVILDPTGEIGQAYEAQHTPHMFVIDKDGKIAYQGAMDDHPHAHDRGLEDAKNYVVAAVSELREGQAVATPETAPYGCSVKY